AEHHPQRSVVMRVLGDFDAEVTPDMSMREARVGDRWLLCSDGLSGFVSADTIAETLRTITDVDQCADRLVQLALRAGGGDNVTVVLADVVDLDDLADGAGPTTNATIVGSAAATFDAPTSAADGPAARAATLTKPEPADDEDDEPDDDEPPRRRRRGWIVAAAAVVLLVAVGVGAWAWTQTQYYVGASNGQVAIFRGIPQTLGPIELSTLVETTDVAVDDLQSAYLRARVDETIHADSLEAARTQVDLLVQDATVPAPAPTPAPTLEPTPLPTPTTATADDA
ncbi:MAG TPA: serine/threonine-protein phosphatase, partial [Cellulomonas sp.]|nr:serine/threonine-protein phosphatase [Cellulomonas sp.]